MAQQTDGAAWRWITPLECYATLGMAVNFGIYETAFEEDPTETKIKSGITSAASLITMPVLQVPGIPARYQAKQLSKFVAVSERIIPPNNALCVLTFAVLGITCYRSSVAAEKVRYLTAAVGLGASVTAYSLTIMLPMNKKMIDCDRKFGEGTENEESVEKEFRELQERWRKLNFIRAALMISTSICGLYTLATHGSIASFSRAIKAH